MDNIADGAALMTGTKVEKDFIKACSNMVLNAPLIDIIYKKMNEIGAPVPDEYDVETAREFATKALADMPNADPDPPIHYDITPYNGVFTQNFGSSDVSDVSWICPTAQLMTASFAFGTPGHSWQETAQGKLPFALKSALYAAKVLAASAIELLNAPEAIEKAKEAHKKAVGPEGYKCPIPRGVRPRAINTI